MAKKIRLIDEPNEESTSTETVSSSNIDAEKLMKFLEAIDWKLWEMLKIMKAQNEEKK